MGAPPPGGWVSRGPQGASVLSEPEGSDWPGGRWGCFAAAPKSVGSAWQRPEGHGHVRCGGRVMPGTTSPPDRSPASASRAPLCGFEAEAPQLPADPASAPVPKLQRRRWGQTRSAGVRERAATEVAAVRHGMASRGPGGRQRRFCRSVQPRRVGQLGTLSVAAASRCAGEAASAGPGGRASAGRIACSLRGFSSRQRAFRGTTSSVKDSAP